MAGSNNKPAKQSQPPKKGAGSSGFKMVQGDEVRLDPLAAHIMTTKASMSMSGPLPPSGEFARYEQTLPGSADRILSMAELEQKERLAENKERLRLDKKLVVGHNWRSGFAQFAALGLVLTAFYESHDLTMHGHETAGIAVSTTTIVAILGAFLGAKFDLFKSNSSDRKTE